MGGKSIELGFESELRTLATRLRQVIIASLDPDFLSDKMGTIYCRFGWSHELLEREILCNSKASEKHPHLISTVICNNS